MNDMHVHVHDVSGNVIGCLLVDASGNSAPCNEGIIDGSGCFIPCVLPPLKN